MSELKAFNHEQFGQVRILETGEEMLFAATDVATALGYAKPNNAIKAHCRKASIYRYPETGMPMNTIPESDVYRLIMHSELPSAEKFQDWIFDEVLPSIRKHGAYMTSETIEKTLTDPDFIISLASTLKEEQTKRRELETKVEADKPKVLFAESVEMTEGLITIAQLSNILKQNGIDIGEKRLYGWLRDNDYIYKDSRQPMQRALNLGLFRVVEHVYFNSQQEPCIAFTTKVTGKGQKYFVDRFLNKIAV